MGGSFGSGEDNTIVACHGRDTASSLGMNSRNAMLPSCGDKDQRYGTDQGQERTKRSFHGALLNLKFPIGFDFLGSARARQATGSGERYSNPSVENFVLGRQILFSDANRCKQMFFLDEAESMPWTAAEVLLGALRTTAVLGACSSQMGVRISQAAPITPHGNICSNSRE